MLKPVLYNADDTETELPTKWAICSLCSGNGKHSLGIEHDGGGITAEEMDELGDDFRTDYFAGAYDRPCEECSGTGKVQIVDHAKMTRGQRRRWRDQVREEREYQNICRMERMMGA